MQLENETLCNCWCKAGDMDSKEKCDKFELIKEDAYEKMFK